MKKGLAVSQMINQLVSWSSRELIAERKDAPVYRKERAAQLYEQGADYRRIGQYVAPKHDPLIFWFFYFKHPISCTHGCDGGWRDVL